MPRAYMTGSQAKQLAGGCAILVGWAWTCYAAGTWQPTADSGAALAVVLWVVFDVGLAGGAPEDDVPGAHPFPRRTEGGLPPAPGPDHPATVERPRDG